MTAPPWWSASAMIEAHPAYRAGWAYAEAELADEPRDVREAAARNMDAECVRLVVNSARYYALMGGLAYLQQRHEGNQHATDIQQRVQSRSTD